MGSNCCYIEEPRTRLGLGEKPKHLPSSPKAIFSHHENNPAVSGESSEPA